MSGKGTLALCLLLNKELSLFPFHGLTLTGQWKTIWFCKIFLLILLSYQLKGILTFKSRL